MQKSDFRILVVDDNPSIHKDFQRILFPHAANASLNNIAQKIFGAQHKNQPLLPYFEINVAYQGQEAVRLIEQALKEERPYALAFVDIRMPPGWDGIETVKQIWQRDEDIQLVLCTAYSDYSWEETIKQLGQNDNFLILKKPFDIETVRQLAFSLTKKWQLTRECRDNLKRLEKANRAKSVFLATMSHEIRTPLNGIIGMAEVLSNRELPAEEKECVDIIHLSGETLLYLINQILDFSKIESGCIEIVAEDFNLRDLIKDSLDIVSTQLHRKKLDVEIYIDPQLPHDVRGDAFRIKQVLINLLSNAVKFTDKGKIILKVSPEISNDKNIDIYHIMFEVIDNGIGIEQSSIQNLFHPFTQSNCTVTKRYGGTGLGLTISKKLVELMGGAIGVDSEEGKGSKFWFTTKFTQSKSVDCKRNKVIPFPVKSQEQRDLHPKKNLHILLVEDNDVNQQVAKKIFANLGYEIEIVENGLKALQSFDNNNYDLIFMDCHLPELDGYDTTKAIRKKEALQKSHIPIIAMTASAFQSDREKCLACGMDDYMSKPINISQLKKLIEKYTQARLDN